MRPICLAMLSGLFFFGLVTGVSAMDVQDIVNRASIAAYYQGKDGRARVHMAIVDSQGRERTRNFTLLRMDVEDKDNGEQKFYVLFNRPADINRTAFMSDRDTNYTLILCFASAVREHVYQCTQEGTVRISYDFAHCSVCTVYIVD